MAKKVNINSLRNLKYFRDMIKPNLVKEDLIAGLAREGERIIKLAYHSRGFKDRTYNLRDSYVSAVYENGRLLKDTIRYVGKPKARVSVEVGETADGDTALTTGREEAERFLSKYQFSKGRKNGIQLVIAAAMFYSGIVESRGYSVLLNVETDLRDLARMGYNGTKYLAHIDLNQITESSIYRADGNGSLTVINM